jgi:hypothetical protein
LLARKANPLAQDVSLPVREVSEKPSSHDQEDLPKEDDVLASISMLMVNSSVASSSKSIGAPIDANEN